MLGRATGSRPNFLPRRDDRVYSVRNVDTGEGTTQRKYACLDVVFYLPTPAQQEGSSLKAACTIVAGALNGPDQLADSAARRPWIRCIQATTLPIPAEAAQGLLLLVDAASLERPADLSALRAAIARDDARPAVIVPIEPVTQERIAAVLAGTPMPLLMEPVPPNTTVGHPDERLKAYEPLFSGADRLWEKLKQEFGDKMLTFDDIRALNGDNESSDHFKKIWDSLVNPTNELIPFVGAGIGCGCLIEGKPGPSWPDLLHELKRIASSFIHPEIELLINEGSYLEAAQKIYDYADSTKIIEHLKDRFRSVEELTEKHIRGELQLSDTIGLIVNIANGEVRRLLITANYDYLLEATSQTKGLKCKSFPMASPDALAADAFDKLKVPAIISIVHIHGETNSALAHIVLNKKQYENHFGTGEARFDEGSFEDDDHPSRKIDLKKSIPKYLTLIAADRHAKPLFIGCSLRNDHILASMQRIRVENKIPYFGPIAIMPDPGTLGKRIDEIRRFRRLGTDVLFYPNPHTERHPKGDHHGLGVLLRELYEKRTQARERVRAP